jgi:hypothetical protein
MSEIIDIFGNYSRAQSWYSRSNDPRMVVYQEYMRTLSPSSCREVWDYYHTLVNDSERNQSYSQQCAERIVDLQSIVDTRYSEINNAFGNNSQGFATFLGNLVEQYSAILAASSTYFNSQTLAMEKPGSSGGMLTGFLVKAGAEIFTQGSSRVQVDPVYDREDLIIGRFLDFNMTLSDQSSGHIGRFLAPLIVVSSKVYVDLTRLENVRAKAESAKRLFPRSLFLVAAQTNALGGNRFCLNETTPIPAAIAPVDDIFFFRACRRQDYDAMRQRCPMRLAPMLEYAKRIRLFLAAL